MSPILLLAAFLMFLFFLYKFVTTKGSMNFPPGPARIPFIGGYLHLLLEDYNYPHIALDKLKKKYNSPIIGMYCGNEKMVIANTYETCREIFNRPEFQARVDGLIPRSRAQGKRLGIFFDDGDDWLHQRRFSLRELRDFGFGRRSESYEQILEEEVRDTLEEINKSLEKGESIHLPDVFYPMMFNCIFHLIFGSRLPFSDREFLKEIGRIGMQFQRSTDATGRLVTLLPFLRFLFPEQTGFKNYMQASDYFWTYARQKVESHVKNLDKEAQRDYIDVYLSKMEHNEPFTIDQLTLCCIDLVFPATAAATAVSFALMAAADNPEIATKCQAELDCVVGRDRLVNLNDRQYLPYTESTLREVFRKNTIAPLGVFHKATENTVFCGYEIPADTIMVTNLWSMHNDEKTWGDPENFRPERFLDHQGNLKKKDISLPFGLGKRVCAGETFARQNIFTIMATLFQNYSVVKDTPFELNKPHPGLIINPPDNLYIKLVHRP